jgi:hypothetical protein
VFQFGFVSAFMNQFHNWQDFVDGVLARRKAGQDTPAAVYRHDYVKSCSH